MFTFHLKGRHQSVGQGGHQCPGLTGRERAHGLHAIGMGLTFYAVQTFMLLRIPCADKRASMHQRKPQLLVDGEIFLTSRAHEFEFKTIGRGIKAGVQNGAVGFGCATENIRAFFDQHHPCTRQRKAPCRGAADNARADNGDIVKTVVTGIALGIVGVGIGHVHLPFDHINDRTVSACLHKRQDILLSNWFLFPGI